MSKWLFLLLLCSSISLQATAKSVDSAILSDVTTEGLHFQLLTAEVDVLQLVQNPELFHAFAPVPKQQSTLRVNQEQVLWLKLKLVNPYNYAWQPLLIYPFLPADRVSFYRVSTEMPTATLLSQSGGELPFSERALPLLRFNQPLQLLAGESITILIRLQDAALLGTQLAISTLPKALQQEQQLLFLDSTLSGIMLLLACLSLFSMRFAGYRAIAWLGGFYLSYMLIFAILNGMAFRFLWPDHPELNPVMLYVAVGLNLFVLSLFCRQTLLSSAGRYHRLTNGLAAGMALVLLFSPLFLIGPLQLQLLFFSVTLCLAIFVIQAVIITLATEQPDAFRYTLLCTLAALCLLLLQVRHLTGHSVWFHVAIGLSLLTMAVVSQKLLARPQAAKATAVLAD